MKQNVDLPNEETMAPPLIVRPDRVSLLRRHGYGFITVLFWLAFLFLFRVALTPLAWLIGFQSVYEMFSIKMGSEEFFYLMTVYLAVIILLGLVLVGWARYNQCRFRHHERRSKFLSPVTPQEIARHYEIDQALMDVCFRDRRIVQQHDANGRLEALDFSGDRLPAGEPEPIPLERGRYRFGNYEIRRRTDYRWHVELEGQSLCSAATLDQCLAQITVSVDE